MKLMTHCYIQSLSVDGFYGSYNDLAIASSLSDCTSASLIRLINLLTIPLTKDLSGTAAARHNVCSLYIVSISSLYK